MTEVVGREDRVAPWLNGEVPKWTRGWRLRRALAHADLNTEEMAAELGVARSTISKWCHDDGKPTLGNLKLWALRCGVPLDWLLYGDEELPRVDSNHQPADMWIEAHPPIPSAELVLAA